MKIAKGDTVQVITGNDKGKTGRVIKVFPSKDKIVIEGQAAEGFTRVTTDTGAIYVIPSHIIKKTAWQLSHFFVTY